MPLAGLAPTGKAFLIASNTSQNVALPATGTPTQALVQNMGDYTIYVLLGTTNAVVVTAATGLPVRPGQQQVLTLGANLYLAAIGTGPLDITLGTSFMDPQTEKVIRAFSLLYALTKDSAKLPRCPVCRVYCCSKHLGR